MKMKLATVFLATIMVAAILFPALTLAASPEVTVTVRPGDTLAGLCDQRNRFSSTTWETQKCVDWVSARNSLVNPDLIRVSEKLVLPASDLAPEPAEVAKVFAEAANIRAAAEAAEKAVKDQTATIAGLEKQLVEARAKLSADEKSAGGLAAKAKTAAEAAEKARTEAPKTQQTTVPPSAATSGTATPSAPTVTPPGLTKAEAEKMIADRISAIPAGPTKADVDAAVTSAIQPLTQRVSALEGRTPTPAAVVQPQAQAAQPTAVPKAASKPAAPAKTTTPATTTLAATLLELGWGWMIAIAVFILGTLISVRRYIQMIFVWIWGQITKFAQWIWRFVRRRPARAAHVQAGPGPVGAAPRP